MGPRTAEFERALADYTGARHALAVANGTAALHLICLAAGLGAGDEVVVPRSPSWPPSTRSPTRAPRRCSPTSPRSSEPWPGAAAVEAAITPRTRAIMAMSYGGHPGEIAALRELAASRGLILLEDAAHGIGVRHDGRHLGTFGAAGAFSFFSNKNLAVGEGGAVVTDDDELAAAMRLLRSHGMTTLSWDRHRGHAAGYDVVALGFNYRIDEPRAALATAPPGAPGRRDRAPPRARRGATASGSPARRRRADAPAPGPPHLHGRARRGDRPRRRPRGARRARRPDEPALPARAPLRDLREGAPELPLTDAYAARAVTLPLFAGMSDEQQDLVIDALAGALEPTGARSP